MTPLFTLFMSTLMLACRTADASTMTFLGTRPTVPAVAGDLDPDECGRAPPALREAMLYTVFRLDSNNDGIIDPTDMESDNILYNDDRETEPCVDQCVRGCIVSQDEWTRAWQCFYGFDEGFAHKLLTYLDVNRLPFFPAVGKGDGIIINRDIKATQIGTTRLTATAWRHTLAELYREYCQDNDQGKYCGQISDIADF